MWAEPAKNFEANYVRCDGMFIQSTVIVLIVECVHLHTWCCVQCIVIVVTVSFLLFSLSFIGEYVFRTMNLHSVLITKELPYLFTYLPYFSGWVVYLVDSLMSFVVISANEFFLCPRTICSADRHLPIGCQNLHICRPGIRCHGQHLILRLRRVQMLSLPRLIRLPLQRTYAVSLVQGGCVV